MERCYICKVDVPRAHIIQHDNSEIHRLNLKICNEANERVRQHSNRLTVAHTSPKIDTYYCDVCIEVINVNILVHTATATHKANELQIQKLKNSYETYINSELKKVDKNNTVQQYIDYLNTFYQIKHLKAHGNIYILMEATNGDKVNLNFNIFHSIQLDVNGPMKCMLCNKNVHIINDHIIEPEHIKKIRESVPDKNCIIKCVDRNVYVCLLCNILMPITQKFVHLEVAVHKANVERALVWENKKSTAIHNYTHHVTDSPDGKIKKYCLCCCVEVPDNINNIEGHVNGNKHINKFKDILEKNKLIVTNDKYLCGVCDCTVTEIDVFSHVNSFNHNIKLLHPASKSTANSETGTESSVSKKNSDTYEPGTECTLCKVDVSGANKTEHKLGKLHQTKIKELRAKTVLPQTVANEINTQKVQANNMKIQEINNANPNESDSDDSCTIGVIKKILKKPKISEITLENGGPLNSIKYDTSTSSPVGMSLPELESYITLITSKFPAKHKIRVINENFVEVIAANGDEVILRVENFHTFSVLSGVIKCLVCYNVFKSSCHHMHSVEHMKNIMIDIMDKHCIRETRSPYNFRVSFCLHCLVQINREDSEDHKTTEVHKQMLELALFTPKRLHIDDTVTLKMFCYPQNNVESNLNTTELDHQLKKTLNPKEVLCRICKVLVPNVESNIQTHLSGGRHNLKKKDFMLDNNIAPFVTDYECQKCTSFVLAKDLFDHIDSH